MSWLQFNRACTDLLSDETPEPMSFALGRRWVRASGPAYHAIVQHAGVLKGSWDLVTGVMIMVTILITTSNPN